MDCFGQMAGWVAGRSFRFYSERAVAAVVVVTAMTAEGFGMTVPGYVVVVVGQTDSTERSFVTAGMLVVGAVQLVDVIRIG